MKSQCDTPVSIRQFTDENLDFLNKNYEFKVVPWPTMIDCIFHPDANSGTSTPSAANGEPAQCEEEPRSNTLEKKTTKTANSDLCTQEAPRYYFRSIGNNPRKDVSDITKIAPNVAKDFTIPPELGVIQDRIFSSVFRMSSKRIRVWTHYDVMDNVLFQVVGEKEVTVL